MPSPEELALYANMSLDEFIMQPDTVEFSFINSRRFQRYIANKPYIKISTVLLAGDYAIAYTKERFIEEIFRDLGSDYLEFFPQILSLLSIESNLAAGIAPLHQHPYLQLTGQGVIIALIDTGIDYTKEAFIYEDGTSKIKYIWDQTIDGDRPDDVHFGSVYPQEVINEALASNAPFSIVPSVDTIGHGTFLASVAAGRERNDYIGAAPDAEIIAVKLKKASRFQIERLNVPDNNNLFSSIDFLLGLKFVLERAAELAAPVVVCIGLGSNFGGHDGITLFEQYLSAVTQRAGIICVAAGGNESNTRHHTNGTIERTGDMRTVSINVGENAGNFPVTILSSAYDKISVAVISPIGETTGRIPFNHAYTFTKRLTLEDSQITVRYYRDANSLAIIDISNPTKGIWNIILYGDAIIDGEYHSWLPVTGVISPNIVFFEPTPYDTIVIPATAYRIITTGAYNSFENSLFVSSSWGPTRLPRMSPDFVAPGVNIKGVYPWGYGTMTGTSVAAAVTSGACALLLQWAIVNENEPGMDLDRVRALLISGCTRIESIMYPNAQWGFGTLNLLNVFNFITER